MTKVTFNETTLNLFYSADECLSKLLQFIDDQGDFYEISMNESPDRETSEKFFQRCEALRILWNTFIDYAVEEEEFYEV